MSIAKTYRDIYKVRDNKELERFQSLILCKIRGANGPLSTQNHLYVSPESRDANFPRYRAGALIRLPTVAQVGR